MLHFRYMWSHRGKPSLWRSKQSFPWSAFLYSKIVFKLCRKQEKCFIRACSFCPWISQVFPDIMFSKTTFPNCVSIKKQFSTWLSQVITWSRSIIEKKLLIQRSIQYSFVLYNQNLRYKIGTNISDGYLQQVENNAKSFLYYFNMQVTTSFPARPLGEVRQVVALKGFILPITCLKWPLGHRL